MTNITTTPATMLDLSRALELRPEATAMLDRITAGDLPDETEYRALQDRHAELSAELRAQIEQMLVVWGPVDEHERDEIVDGVEALLWTIDGTGAVGAAWDEGTRGTESAAFMIRFLDRMRSDGATSEKLWQVYDEFSVDLVDDDARRDVAGWLRSLEG